MQLNLGKQLGLLQQQLQIDPNARITLQIGPQTVINDVSSSKQYVIDATTMPPKVTKASLVVPEWVKEILAASDQNLKKRYVETMGWDEVRETVFTELVCRGVNVLNLDLGHEKV